MSTDLVPLTDTMTLGKVLAQSGFFTDARTEAQAVVKVLAGRELGFGPVASMTGIYIVKGKPSLSANLMAAAVKRSGRYNYRVRDMTPALCRIEFFERQGDKWESVGVSEFTAEDARKAETQNMSKFPRNMLFARAMSNGVRWFCPDVTGGPVYTPEELGEPVDEDGEIVTVTVIQPEQPKPGNGHAPQPPKPEPQPAPTTARPMSPDALRTALRTRAAQMPADTDPKKTTSAGMMTLADMFRTDENQHAAIRYLFDKEHRSALTPGEMWALSKWRAATKNDAGEWIPNGYAIEEARLLLEHLTEQNQIAEPASLFDDADDGDPLAEIEGAED